MKKYFHKLTAMLLAAAIAVPMVPPVTAYAAGDKLEGLTVTREDRDEDDDLEYVYRFTNVTVGTTGMETMIIENATGKVVKPTGTVADNFTDQGYSENDDSFLCVSVPNDAEKIKAYIEAVEFVNDTPDMSSVRVLFVEGTLSGNANANMGYWNGHYYEFIPTVTALTKLDGLGKKTTETENNYWYTTGGKDYLTWEGANYLASQYEFLNMKGYLATLVYKEEQQVVVNKLNGTDKTAAWIGGHYVGVGGPTGYTDPTFKGASNVKYGTIVTDASMYNPDDYTPAKKTAVETAAAADKTAENSTKSGWYWVTEPDGPIRFLAGIPNDDGSGNYLHHDTPAEKAKGVYAIGYGLNVEHKEGNTVTIPAISYWTGDIVTSETDTTGITEKLDYLRDEPNNSYSGDPITTLTEHSMQVTAYNAWNDLPNCNTSPQGFFVEYSGTPVSDTDNKITVVDAKIGAVDINFNLNQDPVSIASGKEEQVNKTQTIVVTDCISSKATKPNLDTSDLTTTNPKTFNGNWFRETEGINQWDFDTAIDKNFVDTNGYSLTLYAGWTGNPEVYVDPNGADGTDEYTEKYGPYLPSATTNIVIDTKGGGGKYRYSGDGEDKDYNTTTTVTVTLAAAGKTLTLYNPTKAGYVFTGWTYTEATKTFTANWAADATVTYTKYNTNGTTAPATDAETIATYPEWYGDTNITLDTDGGTYQGDNLTAADYIKLNPDVAGGHHITLAEAEKEGHTFWGWHYTNSAHRFEAKWQENAVVNYKNTANVTGDHLKEIPVSYDSANPNQLVIDLNGGSSFTLNGETKITGQPVNMTSGVRYEIGDAVHPESKTFAGWKHSKPGDTLPDSSTANKHTLTALWAESAQVNYYAYKNSDEKPDLVNRQTTGYLVTFPEAKGKVYFDAKGTSVDGKYKHGDAEAAATGSIVLNPNVPETVVLGIPYSESNGYTFWGWKYNGTNEENRTFTAMWKKKSTVEYLEYSSQTTKTINNIDVTGNSTTNNLVTLDLDGGTYAGGQTTFNMNAGEDYVIDNSKVTKTGFEFKGWSLDNTGVKLNAIWYKQPVVSYLKNEYGQVDNAPYAIGTSITVTLAADETGSYVLNGTEYDLTSGINNIITLAKDAVLTLNTPVKAGSTFTGWSVSAGGKTFTAEWDVNPTVTYTTAVTGKDDGGYKTTTASPAPADALIGSKIKVDLNDAAATVKYQVGSAAETTFTATESDDDFEITVVKDNNITLNDPSTSGKVFMGWTKSGNPDSVVYTAKWEADVKCAAGTGNDGIPDKFQKTVRFEVVGGSLSPAEATTFVTLTEADGITWSESGSATVTFPSTTVAVTGYKNQGNWTYLNNETEVTMPSGATEGQALANRLLFTFKYLAVNAQKVDYAGTARNDIAPDENELANSSKFDLPYNGKIMLYGNGIADSEYAITDAADQRIPDPTSMPDGMDFFMGWVPVTPIPEGYVYALKATWDVDDINAADDKTTGGDNIPDSYQKVVTFKVVNGIFGTSGNVTEINDYVTLTRDGSANGIWDANGKAVVDIPADMKANHGYRPTGSWDVSALNGAEEVEVTGDETFTYTYLRKPSSSSTVVTPPAAPEEPEVPSVTPSRDYNIPEQLVEEHISYITGYEDGTVRPNNLITRAEVATILYNLLTDEMRTQYHTDENEFTDVPEHMWFNVPISTLVDMLLLSGYDDGTFGPNKYITRAEMAAILARFQVDLPLKDDVEFNDIDASWAKDQIIMVARRGWINGYPDGSYRPNANITRAETMAMINNMLHRNPKTLDDLHVDPKYWEDNSKLDEWYYIHVQEATKTHSHDRNEHGFEIRG